MTAAPAVAAAGVVGAVAVVVGLAGCTDADSGSAPKSSPATTETASFDWDVAFAKCMRDRGHDYPDPKPGGGRSSVQVPPGDATFESDTTACTGSVTKDRGERPVTASERKERDQWNDVYGETVDCLRKKGYDVKVTDGGYSTDDDLADADVQACSAGDGSQKAGGGS